jgi:tRNA (guanine-N7-)-methyltransferase
MPHIKSFVIRDGVLTAAQQSLLNQHGDLYQIQYNDNNPSIFDKAVIEIGYGMGDALILSAQSNPNINYIGIEVYPPGAVRLLRLILDHGISNLKFIQHDAWEVINNMIHDNTISGFNIMFPDPWPKTRHHKRRLMQPKFVDMLVSRLRSGGSIRFATDCKDYAIWAKSILAQSLELNPVPQLPLRPVTKFEKRALRNGQVIYDFMYTKL